MIRVSDFKVIGIAIIGSFSQADEFLVMLSEALQRNAKPRKRHDFRHPKGWLIRGEA